MKNIQEVLISAIENTLKLDRPSTKELVNELDKNVNDTTRKYNVNDFKMIARTELNSMRAINALLTFKQLGLEKYRYTAKMDNRTSKICKEMNGRVFKVEDGLNDETIRPSKHVNCRAKITSLGNI